MVYSITDDETMNVVFDIDFDRQYKVVAVIGMPSSRHSVMSSPLMSLFQIPHISITSTSDELSDKSRFEYFMRVVPPDRFQVVHTIDGVKCINKCYLNKSNIVL